MLIALAFPFGPNRAYARPWPCLPPLFDGGLRLHALPTPKVFWLELLLRQHELCWRKAAPPGELRVVLFGSSAVYGFPLSAEESVGGCLNRHFAGRGARARLFNLAFVNPYQLRDALIIREALAYDPDVILYPLTLAEFHHIAPMPFPPVIKFFDANRGPLSAMISAPPPGLEEPLSRYGQHLQRRGSNHYPTDQLREAGLFVRLGARSLAESIAARLNAPLPPFQARPKGHQAVYDCSETEWKMASSFANWKQWNVLAYLEVLQRELGVQVLIVHWPIAHQPLGACYSVRYTNAAVADFATWLREESAARGLGYLDLHDLLPLDLFLDSLHPSPQGHRRVAEAVARVLDPMLEELWERRMAK
jgi:hypothetical protein